MGKGRKKYIYAALTLIVFGTMTACGNHQAGENSDPPTEEHSVVSEQPEDGEEAKGTEPQSNPAAQVDMQAEGSSAREDTEEETEEMKLNIQVGDTEFTAAFSDNSSVDALKELMADGPLTLNMSDYAGMEKGADLGVTLPQNNVQMNTQAGDIILYQGRTLVIYYDTNSWSLTPVGKMEEIDPEELREVLGTGDVTVTLSLE